MDDFRADVHTAYGDGTVSKAGSHSGYGGAPIEHDIRGYLLGARLYLPQFGGMVYVADTPVTLEDTLREVDARVALNLSASDVVIVAGGHGTRTGDNWKGEVWAFPSDFTSIQDEFNEVLAEHCYLKGATIEDINALTRTGLNDLVWRPKHIFFSTCYMQVDHRLMHLLDYDYAVSVDRHVQGP